MLNGLRKDIIAKRKEFASDVRLFNVTSELILKNTVELIKELKIDSVMLYLPINGEADIAGIADLPLKFYVPVTQGTVIRPALYTANTPLRKGEFGVSVPAEPEYADKHSIGLVLVPAVAVDRNKNRIGYGKGCYDRFLADMDCIKAAVCYDFQVTDGIEPQPHDIKMDYIVTESGYF